MSHRDLIMPPWFNRRENGTCRWCNKPVDEPRRRLWHAACFKKYDALLWEAGQPNRAVVERAGHKCQGCGDELLYMMRTSWTCLSGHKSCVPSWRVECLPWQDDHIIALVDALPHADDPWWAHRFANRQALCLECHQKKTADENTRRARWRRNYKQRALPLEAAHG